MDADAQPPIQEAPPEIQEEQPEIPEGPPEIPVPELTQDAVSFLLEIVDKSSFVSEYAQTIPDQGTELFEKTLLKDEALLNETMTDFPVNMIPPDIRCYLNSKLIQDSIRTLCHAATKPALVPKSAEAAEQAEAERREAREYRENIREIHESGYKNETLPSVYPPTLNQDIANELNTKVKSTKKAAKAAVKEADKRRREAEEATGELETLFNNFRNGSIVFEDSTLRVINGFSPSPLAALLQVCDFLMMDDDIMVPLLRFVASLVSMDPKDLDAIFMVAQPDELQEAIQKYQILKDYNEDLTGGDTDLEGRLAQVIDPAGVGAKEYARKVQEAEASAEAELTANREAAAAAVIDPDQDYINTLSPADQSAFIQQRDRQAAPEKRKE